MALNSLNLKLVRDLKRMRGQCVAIALVVGSGVAVLVMSLTAMKAMTDSADAYYERYRFADAFALAVRAPLGLAAEIRALPGVHLAETRIVKYTTLDVEDFDEPVTAALVSVPENHQPLLNRLVIRSGRYLQSGDHLRVVVNEPFAEEHGLETGDTFTALLNGNKRTLRIVGLALSPEYVYALGPGNLMPDAKRFGVVWMSHDTLSAVYDMKGAFNSVAVSTDARAHMPTLLKSIDALLKPYGGSGAHDRSDQLSNWFVTNEIQQLRSIASILPPIFLVVAAFLTNLVLVRLVFTERTEIGLLKAFGYSHAAVGWHYMKFVLVVCALGIAMGWVAGSALGQWMTRVYADLFRFPVLVYAPEPAVYLISAALSVASSLIGAAIAVRAAATLPPAEAMRPPVPPAFRASRNGLARAFAWIDQPTRIIFRQVFRRPLRALITSFGVAAAVGLLVVSLQWIDAIQFLVLDFFNNQQRQDVMVTLVDTVDDEIATETKRLPGVMAVEAHRYVDTMLHVGHRSHREALAGLPGRGGLQVLSDRYGQELSLPSHGLLVSSALADILEIQVGDTVNVEVLEGRRPTVQVRVAAIFETLIGTPVYMHIDALNRLLSEPDTANVLLLATDELQESTLFERLNELPTVAGVVLKRAAINLFNQTVGESIYVMVGFYTAFAASLAFGVIYNNMRIALSERGRELATMRVLGFQTSEVAYMLFGEAAVLTLIGLPVGCLFGWGLAHLVALSFQTELFRIPVSIKPLTYGYAVVVVLVAAVISALPVAHRLTRFNLVSVLKTRE